MAQPRVGLGASASGGAGEAPKVVVVGEPGVGKTCLIHQMFAKEYNPNGVASIGVECRPVVTPEKKRKLQLWDIAGQLRASYMTKQHYRFASAAVVVCDVSEKRTFTGAVQWRADIKMKAQSLADATAGLRGSASAAQKKPGGSGPTTPRGGEPQEMPIPTFLFINKVDLEPSLDRPSLEKWALEQGFHACFFTSATAYDTTAAAFEAVAAHVYEHCLPTTPIGPAPVQPLKPSEQKKGCPC